MIKLSKEHLNSSNSCRIIEEKLIPIHTLNIIFRKTEAGAECDKTFLCFEDGYFKVRDAINKNYTIIDFGIAYGFQAYIFKDFKKYIGVDIDDCGELICSFLPNASFYKMDVNKWIKTQLKEQCLDLEQTVAICSYNPSYSNSDKCKIIKETFPNYYLKYGEWEEYKLGNQISK